MRTAVWMAVQACQRGVPARLKTIGRTHVEAPCNSCTLQWLLVLVLQSRGHQTRHLTLSQVKLSSAKGSEVDVRNLELLCWFTHIDGFVVCR